MNRRDFVKALAGIPLLGRLAKLLIRDDESQFTRDDEAWFALTAGSAPHGTPEICHSGGKTIFVDLISGDDTNDGLSRDAPVTFRKAYQLITWHELPEQTEVDSDIA